MRFPLLMVAALLASLLVSTAAEAGPFSRLFGRRCGAGGACGSSSSYQSSYVQQSTSCATGACAGGSCASTQSYQASSLTVQNDALDEVNAERASRGLRPFLRDPLLTAGAAACAGLRAARRCAGHLADDFSYLPAGAMARSAGCGAWPQGAGWGTCCTFENYTYAGAAYAIGADGQRYMHLFVR